jgi:hypothetical protein
MITDNYELRPTVSIAEPHHFYTTPGKDFYAAPAPILLYSKAKFLKRTKTQIFVHVIS